MLKSIDSILNQAQHTFNNWQRLSANERTAGNLLSELNKILIF